MGANTNITWADHTFNPWQGCTRVSPACDTCYAAEWDQRFFPGRELWEPGAARHRTKDWSNPIRWNRKAPGVVFSGSLCDVFDNKAPPEWRADLFELIRATPRLLWLLLSKRPQNMAKVLPADWPLPNVWLGVTAENAEEAARRLPILVELPAAGRFVSCEPLLTAVDLRPWLPSLSMVIAGCESDGSHPGARPTRLEWVRSLRDQCSDAGVLFHLKQLAIGERLVHLPELDGRRWPDMPVALALADLAA